MRRLMISAAAMLLMTGGSASATTFNFTFIDPAGGGTGVFTVEKALPAGTYKLSEVGAYSIDFTALKTERFTQANIRTSVSTVLLNVTGVAGDLRMTFGNTQQYGDGPYYGSLDLVSDTAFMAFIPPAATVFESPNSTTVGRFGARPFPGGYSAVEATAAAVPEPVTWSLMVLGFGAIGASLRSRRRTVSVTYA